MIPKPMQVFPQNCDCDMSISDDSFWKFTFYGDNLKYIHYRFCIAETGEYVTDTYVTSPVDVYSGEEITIPHDSNDGIFVNGNNYKYSIILFQQDYNIPVIRGRIRGSESTTTIYLPYGVTNVSEPYYDEIDGVRTLVGGMYLEINGERKFIVSVDLSETVLQNGESVIKVTVDSAFSYAYDAGYTYKLYSNYKPSDEYFFRARKKPSVTTSAIYNQTTGFIDCTSTYAQENGITLRCTQWQLFKGEKLIEESSQIYSGRLEYTFFNGFSEGNYTVKCNITTQGDVTVSASTSIAITATETTVSQLTVTETNGVCVLNWAGNSDRYNIYRSDSLNNDNPEYLGTSFINSFTDYSVPNRTDCTYYVVTAGKKAGTVKYFQNNMSFWLYALKALNNNTYKAIECLQLPFNPCLTENSFSFVAGNINNSNIDVGYRYKVQFDKFLNKSPLFLLRTISGQNIIISATEVSFTIDNEVSALPYTITVNFEKSGGENYRIL